MMTLWIAVAGGLGAGSGYGVDSWARARVPANLPWSTHLVNVSGALALGLIVGLGAGSTWVSVAGVGFLGGYTTFSTASIETAQLTSDRRFGAALANAVVMLVLSVAAASLGYLTGELITS